MEQPVSDRAAAIAALRSAVMVFPELRIGQILLNATPPGKDLYYATDQEVAARLRTYMQEHGTLHD